MSKRKRNLIILVGALALLVVVAVVASRGKHADVTRGTTQRLSYTTFTVKLPENGVVMRPMAATFRRSIAGNIGQIYVQAGDRGKRGRTARDDRQSDDPVQRCGLRSRLQLRPTRTSRRGSGLKKSTQGRVSGAGRYEQLRTRSSPARVRRRRLAVRQQGYSAQPARSRQGQTRSGASRLRSIRATTKLGAISGFNGSSRPMRRKRPPQSADRQRAEPATVRRSCRFARRSTARSKP